MNKILKAALIVAGSFLFLATLIYLFRFPIAGGALRLAAHADRDNFFAHSPEPNAIKYAGEIEADARALAEDPLFASLSGGKADAGPFLNPMVEWEEGAEAKHSAKLLLPSEVSGQLAGKNFTEAKINWAKSELNFSWFKELSRFDHWAFDEYPPYYGLGKTYLLAQAPLPNYARLTDWAKLRLLKGKADQNIAAGLTEVDQLVRLVFSTENRIGVLSAIGMIGVQRTFFLSLPPAEQGKLKWRPRTPELVGRAKRFFYGQNALADLRLSPATFEKFAGLAPGICNRVNETIEQSLPVRTLLRSDLTPNYERLNALVARTAANCRPSFSRRMWATPEYRGLLRAGQNVFEAGALDPAAGKDSEFPSLLTVEDLERNPSLGLPLTYLILGIAEPNYLRLYEGPLAK